MFLPHLVQDRKLSIPFHLIQICNSLNFIKGEDIYFVIKMQINKKGLDADLPELHVGGGQPGGTAVLGETAGGLQSCSPGALLALTPAHTPAGRGGACALTHWVLRPLYPAWADGWADGV